MLIVGLDILQEALDVLRKINEVGLEDIVWVDSNLNVQNKDMEDMEEFKYTGLNNVEFARSYKGWVK